MKYIMAGLWLGLIFGMMIISSTMGLLPALALALVFLPIVALCLAGMISTYPY